MDEPTNVDSGAIMPLWALLIDALGDMKENGKRTIPGVPTGFTHLDEVLGGMHSGELVYIGARPAVGALMFEVQMALAAARAGRRVLFFSIMQTADSLAKRMLAIEAGIPLSEAFPMGMRPLRGLSDATVGRLTEAAQRLSSLDINIDDSSRLDPDSLDAKARLAMEDIHEIEGGIVFIDSLQLLATDAANPVYAEGRLELEAAGIKLKRLARELGMPVIALTGLDRAIETRHWSLRRPGLADLRVFGTIEKDADTIIFLDRSLTEVEAEIEGRPDYGELVVEVAKHRSGPVGMVYLNYDVKTGTAGDRPLSLYESYLTPGTAYAGWKEAEDE